MKKIFNTSLQEFIFISRYSRWINSLSRRETWNETIQRFMTCIVKHIKLNNNYDLPIKIQNLLHNNILNMKVMPSMRALMSAGIALKKNNIAAYNCAYITIDSYIRLDEIMYILMSGTGIGFSVEKQYIKKLPLVKCKLNNINTTIIVKDSKKGWAIAYRQLLTSLYDGNIPKWDLSKIRLEGERLKTFGGYASGPKPLNELFNFTIKKFKSAKGRKLNALELHDIICKIGTIVISGGVRRSALLSLSDLSDKKMNMAKQGSWWIKNQQRAISNNSATYLTKPSIEEFSKEWKSLYDSKSGERGIFNRQAATLKVKENNRRDINHEFGCNPCSEVILRSCEFCNLSEVIIRPNDTFKDISEKIRIATILGTIQATFTNFNYIDSLYKKNCEEERLLGVSLTGIMDNNYMNITNISNLHKILPKLRNIAINTNKKWASLLGINQSTAITCIKPSGTVSLLTNTSAGIHSRMYKYYYRSVRINKFDPISKFLIKSGVKYESDVCNPEITNVFTFPCKSPKTSIYSKDLTALEQLKFCNIYNKYWCEHKVSTTIYIKEHEWIEVRDWIYNNFNDISGIAFLPFNDHIYKQAPFIECTEQEYFNFKKYNLDWIKLQLYEKKDCTKNAYELACKGNICGI